MSAAPSFAHSLEQTDPDVFDAIRREARRQEDHVELIASENYASQIGRASCRERV